VVFRGFPFTLDSVAMVSLKFSAAPRVSRS
jgi:hypothetical protein